LTFLKHQHCFFVAVAFKRNT